MSLWRVLDGLREGVKEPSYTQNVCPWFADGGLPFRAPLSKWKEEETNNSNIVCKRRQANHVSIQKVKSQ